MENVLTQHITKTPGVCGGRACIAGHRIRVQDIVVLHEMRGMPPKEIVAEYPGISLTRRSRRDGLLLRQRRGNPGRFPQGRRVGAMGRGESALADPARNEREARWLSRSDSISTSTYGPMTTHSVKPWIEALPSTPTRPMGKRLWGRLPACPMQARRLHHNAPERCAAGSPGLLAGRKVTRSFALRTSAESPLAIVRKRPESSCRVGRACETHADCALTLALSPCRAIVISP